MSRRVVTTRALYTLDNEALSKYKVLVAGATGATGRRVVDVLVENGVQVKALVRDTDKARTVLPGVGSGSVEIVKGDVYQYATLNKAIDRCNAVICATGSVDRADPLGPFKVDYQGTKNLVAISKMRKVKKFVLVTSIGADELINPLNLFWGILFWKKRAEEDLQRSGLDYTIVRPGGLKNKLRDGEKEGSIIMKPAGFYGVPPLGQAGSILRRQVAEVCVSALYEPEASNKVVEIIAKPDAAVMPLSQLFSDVQN